MNLKLPAFISTLALFAVRALAADPAQPQQEKHFEAPITVTAKINYLLFLPQGYDKSKERWPLILFLHGAGESGTNLAKVKVHGPPKIVDSKPDFPFIVVSPQSPGFGWNPDTLNALLNNVVSNYRVDRHRIYLTGLSMGGFGTWALAAAHPEKFAAIAPICGGGEPADAGKLAGLPIWVFHGVKDQVVPIQRSRDMVEAVKAAGGNVKFTEYPEAGHDSWTATYNNPELYDWFLAHKR
jgi:predicted peptidase